MVDENKCSREKGVVFKIDFEKVSNHVNLGFCDHALKKKEA